jgi:cysteine-rich repeat protein
LPAGNGYTIEMNATSTTEPTVTCVGVSLPFNITAGGSAVAHVDLECTGEETRGEVKVDGTWNNCPEITAYTAAPLVVGVGGHISLTAAAADADNFGGNSDPQNFLWSASIGNFGAAPGTATATTATATYNCSVAGTATITLTVADGDASLAGPCSDTTSFTVSCVSVGCGNGTIDGLETCDDGNTANGDACPSDCTVPVCGDGVVENATGFPVENCDDGAGANCPADCTVPVCGDGDIEGSENCDDENSVNTDACPNDCTTSVCGDNVVEGTETCDVGPAGSATCVNCQGVAPPAVCGDGAVAGSEECDPASGIPSVDCGVGYDKDGSGPLAAVAGCYDVTSPTCEACETDNCPDLVNACDALTGNATTGPGAGTSNKVLCYQALECVRNENCVGANGALDCFCGTAAGTACFTAPNGACKDVLLRALLTTDAGEAAANFGDISRPGGWAMQRAVCDVGACSGQGCF